MLYNSVYSLYYLLILGASILYNCAPLPEKEIPQKDESTEGTRAFLLVWSDEFEVDGPPDPSNWSFEQGFVRNREIQWYQEDNAFVENGVLVIEGRRDTFPNPHYDPDNPDWRFNRPRVHYTSSSLNTLNKHSWKYGRFEIRAKIIAEEGLWPAIWTLGTGHEWPSGGEIDIMEYYGGNILANAAWAGSERWQALWDDSKTPVSSFGEPEWDQEFHIWRMDWDASEIKIYVDDQLLNTIDLSKTINQRGNVNNPFRGPEHYILLNLAIGGQNGGNPKDTPFPSRYEIDYVRVYQKE